MVQSARTFPTTSTALRPISAALTRALNAINAGPEDSLVVKLVEPADLPDWQERPLVWRTLSGDLIVNYGHVYNFTRHALNSTRRGTAMRAWFKTDTAGEITGYTRDHIDALVDVIDRIARNAGREYKHYTARGTLNPKPIASRHRDYGNGSFLERDIARAIGGYSVPDTSRILYSTVVPLLREANAAVISDKVLNAPWFKTKVNGYAANVVKTLEEVRLERIMLNHLMIDTSKEHSDEDILDAVAHSNWRNALTYNAGLINPLRSVVEQMTVKDENGEISVPRFALLSTLILGRVHTNLYPKYALKSFTEYVESIVGDTRLATMQRIWDEYTRIADPTERVVMDYVKQWMDMFPSDSGGGSTSSSMVDPDAANGDSGEGGGEGKADGEKSDGEGSPGSGDNNGLNDSADPGDLSGDDSNESSGETRGERGGHGTSTDNVNNSGKNSSLPPGNNEERLAASGMDEYLKSLADLVDKDVKESAAARSFSHDDPRHPTPSQKSYADAEHRYEASTTEASAQALDNGSEFEPTTGDRQSADTLGRALKQLNVRDRGKFVTSNRTPPGRLRSRAALQQKAERRLQLPANAEPWRRTRHTVDLNPPITVGIATDVSGSMGWAEQLSARLAWIIQHAGSSVNARAAAVAFGEGATVTLRPNEQPLKRAQVIPADGGGENFDQAMGTLDVMLNLINGTGVRVLFIITDGHFVFANMLPRAAAWVDQLTKKGVTVLWVCHVPEHDLKDGYTNVPKGAVHVDASALSEAASSFYREDDTVARQNVESATLTLINTLGTALTNEIRNAKYGM